ncbi:MAG: hypothetical protein ACAI44_05120 [Candidatus Sericytochromatia bacterium]
MTDLPINPQLVARSYDSNRDGKVSDNLKVRQDAETLRAVGGDADVSVDELANALKNDNVIIKDGEIQANPNVTLRVPLMLDGYGGAQQIAAQAIGHSQTYVRSPEKLIDSRAGEYDRKSYEAKINEVSGAHHEISRQAFDSLHQLRRQAFDLKDPNLDRLLESASRAIDNSPKYPDSGDYEINRLVYAKSQEQHIKTIQAAFKTVSDYLNKFEQPLSSARSANSAINSAQKQVDREKQAVANKDKAVSQLNTEIKEIKESYNPFFRETRMDSRKEKIKTINTQVDAYSVNSRQEKLEKLARQNYENVVKALDGYDFKEGAEIKARTQDILKDADTIGKAADKNADIVEDALD